MMRWLIVAVVVTCAVVGCQRAPSHARSAIAADGVAAVWVTTSDSTRLLTREADISLTTRVNGTDATISVDTSATYQTMAGFGAALTDASAFLLAQRMSRAQRDSLMRELFGGGAGLSLSLLRLTVGSSDFSASQYTLDDVAAGERDTALTHFSLEPNERDVVPLAREARAINPRLLVFAAPWSAPAWMKSTGSLIGGTLRRDAYKSYAAYLVRFAEESARLGVPIYAMSLQNEPHFEPKDYPGMRLTPEQRVVLFRDYVGPLFARRGVPTRLLEWDHNWDDPSAPLKVLADSGARRFVSGVAWHCYGGDVDVQSAVHDAFPDKESWFTECSGGEWAPKWGDNLLWNARTLIVGTTRNWARGVMYWNLALDEHHGPHAGGCGDCRGVVTIDSRSGAVSRNVEYYVLAHASRFVAPGSVRVKSESSGRPVDHVVFLDREAQTLTAIIVNSEEREVTVGVDAGSAAFVYRARPRSVATVQWRVAKSGRR